MRSHFLVVAILVLCCFLVFPATAANDGENGITVTSRDSDQICTTPDGTTEIVITGLRNASAAVDCSKVLAGWEPIPVPLSPAPESAAGTRTLLTYGVDDTYTKALLHFNGIDGSTTFTDETGKIWYPVGNTQISTAQSKFGGASLNLDGTGDYLYTADSPDWDLGSEFTVDFWVRFNELPEYTILVGSNAMDSRYYTPGWLIAYQQATGGLRVSCNKGYANWPFHLYTSWTPETGTWYHVAVSRDSSNTIRTFINGQQTGSLVNTNSLTSGTQPLFIGGINGLSASSLNGNIDEVRISKGVARWTSSFTPPDHEYGPAVAPVADFTATPLTGTAPLTVTFTDTSENYPTSWSWDFGDGDSTNSTQQDPVHTYASAGTYTVGLTAANAAGSDGEEKAGYVEVTAAQTTYTVYAEAVSDYHGGQPPLGSAVPLAQTFYQNIIGSNSGGITWTGNGEYYNDDAGSKHWSTSEISSVKADDADFALFAGHGANDRIYFGTSNSVLELLRSDIQFGGSKGKWITLSSCSVLDEDTHTNWNSVFNGLHILNSYETEGLLYDRQGGIYAAYLTGGMFEGEYYQVQPIRNAWRKTLEKTINHPDYFGASKWAEPCGDDYLPGYGPFCSAPSTSITYEKFDCDLETSD